MPSSVIGWSSGRRVAALTATLGLLTGQAAAQQTVAAGQTGAAADGTLTFGGDSQSQTPSERYNIEPTRTPQPPRLDGVLNEEEWRSAAVIQDFIQQEPSEGDPATERTVVRLMYDERALYIGVEASDSIPNGVIATEMRRDSRQLLDEDNFPAHPRHVQRFPLRLHVRDEPARRQARAADLRGRRRQPSREQLE